MGNLLSPLHIIILLLLILVLFGRGKISDFMGDFAKGINSFKKGLKDDDKDEEEAVAPSEPVVVKTIDVQSEDISPAKGKAAPRKTTAAKTTARKSVKTKS